MSRESGRQAGDMVDRWARPCPSRRCGGTFYEKTQVGDGPLVWRCLTCGREERAYRIGEACPTAGCAGRFRRATAQNGFTETERSGTIECPDCGLEEGA